MYNEKMESLISAALADGVLTEKEKQILFKKAESMGIDLDEFEMVLDARLVELKKKEAREAERHALEMEKAKIAQKSAPKSNKYGDVRKCPACGAIVESFQTKCPECGHEFANVDANITTKKFQKKLEEIDAEGNGAFGGIGKFFGTDAITTKKVQLIQTFPIPNAKEDLLEMLLLCYSNSEGLGDSSSASDNKITEAWRLKSKQVVEKAKMLLKDVPEAQEIISKIEKEAKQRKLKKTLIITIIVVAAIALYGGLGLFGLKSCVSSEKEAVEAMDNLKVVSNNIDKHLKAGDIDSAANELSGFSNRIHDDGVSELFRSLLAKVIGAYKQVGEDEKAKNLFLSCIQKVPSYDKEKMKELAAEVGVQLDLNDNSSSIDSESTTSSSDEKKADEILEDCKKAVKEYVKYHKKYIDDGDFDYYEKESKAEEKFKELKEELNNLDMSEKQVEELSKLEKEISDI